MVALWIIKLVTLLSTLVCTLIFALIPFKLVKPVLEQGTDVVPVSSWRSYLPGLLNCFSGGVFLSTTLLHMFPELHKGFDDIYAHYNKTISYPMAELTISVGFFLIIIIEHSVLSLLKRATAENVSSAGTIGQYGTGETVVGSTSSTSGAKEREPLSDDSISDTQTRPKLCHNHASHKQQKNELSQSSEYQALITKPPVLESCDVPEIHSVRSFVLLLALSIHTIFEGLAIGLLTDANAVWNLFAAVLIHKIVVAFSLGTQFAENVTYQARSLLFMVLFSFVSPIGIAIGIAISEANGEGIGTTLASTILQGLATGTFLHVTFFEILAKEIGGHSTFFKIFIVVLGYACIAVVSVFSE